MTYTATLISVAAADAHRDTVKLTARITPGCRHVAVETFPVSRFALDAAIEAELGTPDFQWERAATAQLIRVNDMRVEEGAVVSYDAIEIRRAGVIVETIEVPSSDDPDDYDAAVAWAAGSDLFHWLPAT